MAFPEYEMADRAASAVEEAVHRAERAASSVHEAWDVLRARIDFVVQPDQPHPEIGDTLNAVSKPESKLVVMLNGHAARLESLVEVMRDVTRRIDT